MSRKIAIFASVLLCPTVAGAQEGPGTIVPYSPSVFSNCLGAGVQDVTTEFKISDPAEIFGSLVYITSDVGMDGVAKSSWTRQPVAVPFVVTQASNVDTPACSHTIEATANGNLSILGFSINAEKSDVYKMDLRMLAKQTVEDVQDGTIKKKAWISSQYKPSFAAAFASIEPTITSARFFDSLTLYVLRIEKYKRSTGGLGGAIGWLAGGAAYKRDEGFRGTRLIATGTSTKLNRAFYAGPIAPSPAQPRAIGAIPSTALEAVRARAAQD